MDISSNDWAMRAAAFGQIRRLQTVRDQLTSADLAAGFQFSGERIPLVNPQRGIFKPRQMEALLSIRTVFPKSGAKVWYDDQRKVHQQIFDGDETVDYSFMGADPEAADNLWLREAMERQVPFIYFLGVSPGRYQAVFPAFIAGWDSKSAKAQVAFSVPVRVAIGQATSSPSIISRRCDGRLQRSVCDFRHAGIHAAGCCSHHHRQRRGARAACRSKRNSAF